MTTLKSSDKQSSDILVVGLSKKSGKLSIESGSSSLNNKALLATLEDLGATGKADEVIKIPHTSPRMVVFTGLGETQSDFSGETLRRAAGAATRALGGHKNADFSLPHKNSAQFAAIAEGIALGAYNFTDFRGSTKADQKAPLAAANVVSKIGAAAEGKAALKRAEIIAAQTHMVRNLVNTPPSHLTPDSFSQDMKKIATSLKLKTEIFTHTVLKSKGFGGITGVGQGSANPPRLLHISYTPKNGKVKKKYAFVGKGITFDTGGLALKPALGMEAMKSDMSGAAAVTAAAIAIASLKLPVAIEAWAPLAENMPSDTATRPSDILTMYGGKTVEVLNPDAEGRLVLGDALVKAQEVKKLDGIIDVATLTGAQVIALGTRTSAVMTNNPEFSAHFMDVIKETGELFWPMPLPVELRASLDSPVADLANIGERMGGMLVAGLFLKDFVSDDLPWLHLDIAGPAFNEGKAHGYTPVGGTGVALRSLVQMAVVAARG